MAGKGRIENLKPFKKGKPGGPGRPKGSLCVKELVIKHALEKVEERFLEKIEDPAQREKFRNMMKAEIGAYRIVEDYMHGDKDARKLFVEMIDGKAVATTNVNVTGKTHDEVIQELGEDDEE